MVTIADCPSLQFEVIFANRIAVALMPRLDHHWSQHQALSMGSRRKVALVVKDEGLDKLDGCVVELHLIGVLVCMDGNNSGITSSTVDGCNQVVLVEHMLHRLLVVILSQALIAVGAEGLPHPALVRPNL